MPTMEAEILIDIKNSESKADEIIERAKKEKEAILHQTAIDSSKLLISREDELRKSQEKKIIDFREKARMIKEEKISEGKTSVKQLRAKSEKNIQKAVEFVLKKFEEMI